MEKERQTVPVTDNMIMYVKNSNRPIRKEKMAQREKRRKEKEILELISELNQGALYKINTHKSIACLISPIFLTYKTGKIINFAYKFAMRTKHLANANHIA